MERQRTPGQRDITLYRVLAILLMETLIVHDASS